MKTYWDLTESERAKLSGEDVETFVAAELMTHGVVKVDPPKYEDEPTAPEPGALCFRIRERSRLSDLDVAFANAEDARTFLALRPIVVDTIWTGTRSVPYLRQIETPEVYQTAAYNREQADASRAVLELAGKAKERNEKLRRDYEQELEAQQRVLEAMWNDWREQQAKARRLARVIETFGDYQKTAGNAELAAKFLYKAFGSSDIEEAAEWFGVAIPDPNAAVCASMKMPA